MQETQEMRVQSLGREDPLERTGSGNHSGVLAEKSHGQRSLVGYSLWNCSMGHDWAHTQELGLFTTVCSIERARRDILKCTHVSNVVSFKHTQKQRGWHDDCLSPRLNKYWDFITLVSSILYILKFLLLYVIKQILAITPFYLTYFWMHFLQIWTFFLANHDIINVLD